MPESFFTKRASACELRGRSAWSKWQTISLRNPRSCRERSKKTESAPPLTPTKYLRRGERVEKIFFNDVSLANGFRTVNAVQYFGKVDFVVVWVVVGLNEGDKEAWQSGAGAV